MADVQVICDDLLLIESSLGHAPQFGELVVSKALHAEAYTAADDREDHGNELLTVEQRKTEQTEAGCDGVEDQNDIALGQAAVQQFVVNVLTITDEKRLAVQKAADDGEDNVENRQTESHHGDRHGDHSRRLLGAGQCHGAEHKPDEQTAGVSQKYGCRVEVKAQESENGPSQRDCKTRDEGIRNN